MIDTDKIKFRARRNDTDKMSWISGSFVHIGDEYYIIECDGMKTRVSKDSVSMFTGFLDSVGREIYTGDILAYNFVNLGKQAEPPIARMVEVVFECGVMNVTNVDYDFVHDFLNNPHYRDVRVIGHNSYSVPKQVLDEYYHWLDFPDDEEDILDVRNSIKLIENACADYLREL